MSWCESFLNEAEQARSVPVLSKVCPWFDKKSDKVTDFTFFIKNCYIFAIFIDKNNDTLYSIIN